MYTNRVFGTAKYVLFIEASSFQAVLNKRFPSTHTPPLQGRVLFDVLIYQLSNEVYYLECDAGARDDVIKHLRKYALRTKVCV